MRIKTYEDIIDNKEDVIFIDVRTKKEFEEETIPCSINIPIFTDEERVTIGTLYKKDGPRVAMEVGIKCVSEKLPEIFNKIIELDKQRKTMVFFCARGGMRSSSVVGLFLGLKFNVAKLDFGYKGYRSVINQRLPLEMEKIKLITLYGKTGTGKTEVLHNLKLLGADILDLEGCANHRGSILGSIGKSQPNSQKQFEGLVFDTLIKRKTDVLFTEGESKRIGKVVMQDFMYNKLLSSYKIFVEAPLDFRVNVIEKDYINADFKQSDLLNGIEKLKRYMSNEKAEKLLENIKVENYKNVIEDLMVNYYDLNYSCKDKVFDETVVNTDSYQLANKILSNHIM